MDRLAEALTRAQRHWQAGAWQEAEAICRDVLSEQPAHPAALQLLGILASEAGRHDEAVLCFLQARSGAPQVAAIHANLGLAYMALAQFPEAAASFEEALRLQPALADAHFNLGNTRFAQRRLDEAVHCYRQALALRPDHGAAHANLGVVLSEMGEPKEAVACYQRALQLQPPSAGLCVNWGNALRQLGRHEEAAGLYRQALSLDPRCAEAYHSLGCVLQEQNQPVAEAMACYRQALAFWPTLADAHRNLGKILVDLGDVHEAEACLRQALALQPTNARRVDLATLLPPIWPSTASMLEWRQRLADNIRRLRAEQVAVDLGHEPPATLFNLTYHGLDDRNILSDYARLFVPPQGDWPRPQPGVPGASRKIRVGFVSRHFRNHTIGELMRGLVAHLDRDRFVVHVVSVGQYEDEIARFLREHADVFFEVPANLPAARTAIAGLGLDVLLYPDIGIEPVTYGLAFSRLAPVQCTTWGHPSTTGLPTIDYFLSSELFEIEEADEHYTEKLVRLPTIPAYCYRPAHVPLRLGPEAFGLPPGCHLYACPQSLFKIHPDFDEMLGMLLRRDPRGIVTFDEMPGRNWHEQLSRRFATRLPDVADRIRFLPRLTHESCLRLNAAASVLDTTAYNLGNTSYEVFAHGTPIVTLPGTLLKSRLTLGIYRKMGVMDCVAKTPEEYVATALRLAEDPDHRAAVQAKILAANHVLYEDMSAVRALEDFFQKSVDAHR